MKISSQDILALAVSVALHVLIAALLWFGAPELFQKEAPKVIPVKAVFLDSQRQQAAAEKARQEAERQRELEAQRKAEQARKKREEEARLKAEAEKKRKAEEARKQAEREARKKAEAQAKREAEEKARREAEAKRQAEEEARRKKAAEEAARKKAEEQRKKRQQETERRLREALAAEEAALQAEQEAAAQAARDNTDREKYILRLSEHIQRNWARPAGIEDDFSCEIRIRQLPGGQIQSYELLESCGNSFLDASVESAIRKSDPLPLPQNPRVFEKDLKLTFKP